MKTLLEQYKQYLLSIHSSIVYHNVLRPFIDWLEKNNYTLEGLDNIIMTSYLQTKNYKTTSLNLFINAGRSFFKFAKIQNTVFADYKIQTPESRLPKFATENEIDIALSYLKTYKGLTKRYYKIELVVWFLFYTGVRRSELLHIKRVDINLDDCSVKIWGKKTKTERIVYYPEKVKKLLVNYFHDNPIENGNAFGITDDQLRHIPKILKRYNPNIDWTLHLLRHSFAHYCVKKGINIQTVSRLLGHKRLETSMIYCDPSEQELQEEYKKRIK